MTGTMRTRAILALFALIVLGCVTAGTPATTAPAGRPGAPATATLSTATQPQSTTSPAPSGARASNAQTTAEPRLIAPSTVSPSPVLAPAPTPRPTARPTRRPSATPSPILQPIASVGQVSAAPAKTTNPLPTAKPTATRTTAAGPPDGTITLADNGSTLTLAVGERLILKLGTDYDWTVSDTDQSVLARVRNATLDPGTQGVYAAVGPGKATLAAVGDPPCRKSTPACGAPSILFQVSIVVR